MCVTCEKYYLPPPRTLFSDGIAWRKWEGAGPRAVAPKEAPPDPEATKKEAAAIVAAANKDYKQRLADREKAKTATAEDLQAMINAKLNISK